MTFWESNVGQLEMCPGGVFVQLMSPTYLTVDYCSGPSFVSSYGPDFPSVGYDFLYWYNYNLNPGNTAAWAALECESLEVTIVFAAGQIAGTVTIFDQTFTVPADASTKVITVPVTSMSSVSMSGTNYGAVAGWAVTSILAYVTGGLP